MRSKQPKETMAGLRRQLAEMTQLRRETANDAGNNEITLRASFQRTINQLNTEHTQALAAKDAEIAKEKCQASDWCSRMYAAEERQRQDREFFERVIAALVHVPPVPQKDADGQ